MRMNHLVASMVVCGLFPMSIMAQHAAVDPSARAGVDAGNRAWIDGLKTSNIGMISATYADAAVDCDAAGECILGRTEIERHMYAQLASLGRANSATVRSWGASQQGDFVFEWGQAEATFDGGKKLVERYLTAWQRQSDGGWKIFRNMVIPVK